MRVVKNKETIGDLVRLQARILKYRNENSDLPKYAVAKRFGLTAARMDQLLRADPPYPARYKQSAARLNIDIEIVAKNYEEGKRHCGFCNRWDDTSQFGLYSSNTPKHKSARCKGEY